MEKSCAAENILTLTENYDSRTENLWYYITKVKHQTKGENMGKVVMENKHGEICCELVYDGSYWRFPDSYDTDYPFEIGDSFRIVKIEDTED